MARQIQILGGDHKDEQAAALQRVYADKKPDVVCREVHSIDTPKIRILYSLLTKPTFPRMRMVLSLVSPAEMEKFADYRAAEDIAEESGAKTIGIGATGKELLYWAFKYHPLRLTWVSVYSILHLLSPILFIYYASMFDTVQDGIIAVAAFVFLLGAAPYAQLKFSDAIRPRRDHAMCEKILEGTAEDDCIVVLVGENHVATMSEILRFCGASVEARHLKSAVDNSGVEF